MIEKELSGAAIRAIYERAGDVIEKVDSPEMRIQIAEETTEAVKAVLKALCFQPSHTASPTPD